MDLFVAILAGGSGTRFWPASTREVPKQFLPLDGSRSLLRATYERVAALAPPDRFAVVAAERFADGIRELLPELPRGNVIGEPAARNTAAACGLAARWALSRSKDAVMLVLAADHAISPEDELRNCLAAAAEHASTAGSLVALGLRPTRPATSYGWIRVGERVATRAGRDVHRVDAFVEKPDRARAERFLKEGGHLWNLSMFAWRADAFLAALERHQPEVAARTALAMRSPASAYEDMPAISVDHGVMERHDRVDVVPCAFSWDDLGSFPALSRHLPKDAAGNCSVGPLLAIEAEGCLAWAEDGMTALLGVKDLIVVRANGVTLVAPRARAEEVRRLVDALGPAGLSRFA